jgi:hypothetical protein
MSRAKTKPAKEHAAVTRVRFILDELVTHGAEHGGVAIDLAIESMLEAVDFESVSVGILQNVFAALMADDPGNTHEQNAARRAALLEAAESEHRSICACCRRRHEAAQ